MSESNGKYLVATAPTWNPEQIALIKSQIAVNCTDAELALFGHVCQRTGLDPFSRQIYAIKRGNKMTVQVGIDGFRTIAARSGMYGGSMTEWCGDDGTWRDVWLSSQPPAAAKATVWRIGSPMPFTGIARLSSYQQNSPIWRSMPDTMIGKCAESLALRKAFPAELSGLYTVDELPPEEPPIKSAYQRIEEAIHSPDADPATYLPDRIQDTRAAVMEMLDILSWTEKQQFDWAQTITRKPSKEWGLREWELASVNLQEIIDRQGLTQNLIEAGADY